MALSQGPRAQHGMRQFLRLVSALAARIGAGQQHAKSDILRVLLVEDQPHQQAVSAKAIADVLERMNMRCELTVRSNKDGAIQSRNELDAQNQQFDVIVTDEHMSESGQSDQDGSMLIAEWIEWALQKDQPLPRILLLSGTISRRLRSAFEERGVHIETAAKDGISPAIRPDSELAMATAAKLEGVLSGRLGTLTHDIATPDAIRMAKAEAGNMPSSDVLAGAVKAWVDHIIAQYPTIMATVAETRMLRDIVADHTGADRLFAPNGNPQATRVNIHEFKNELLRLITILQARPEKDAATMAQEVIDLHVHINQHLNSREGSELDVVECTERTCSNLAAFHAGEIQFSTELARLQTVVDADRHQQLLSLILGNARKYGEGNPVQVSVDAEGMLTVQNVNTGPALPMTILKNEVIDGQLPASSSETGSGLGLQMMLDIADELGMTISMYQAGQNVCVTASYPEKTTTIVAQEESAEQIAEHMGTVMFADHGGDPEGTFKGRYKFPEGFAGKFMKYKTQQPVRNLSADDANNTGLLVFHSAALQKFVPVELLFDNIQQVLQSCPHANILFVGSYPEQSANTATGMKAYLESIGEAEIAARILTTDDLQTRGHEFSADQLHSKTEIPDAVWSTLLQVSRQDGIERALQGPSD